MMISPGYSYQKAPDQQHFLKRSRTTELFSKILSNPEAGWQFSQSLFLEFLKLGQTSVSMYALGEPTYNVFRLAAALLFAAGGYAQAFGN